MPVIEPVWAISRSSTRFDRNFTHLRVLAMHSPDGRLFEGSLAAPEVQEHEISGT